MLSSVLFSVGMAGFIDRYSKLLFYQQPIAHRQWSASNSRFLLAGTDPCNHVRAGQEICLAISHNTWYPFSYATINSPGRRPTYWCKQGHRRPSGRSLYNFLYYYDDYSSSICCVSNDYFQFKPWHTHTLFFIRTSSSRSLRMMRPNGLCSCCWWWGGTTAGALSVDDASTTSRGHRCTEYCSCELLRQYKNQEED